MRITRKGLSFKDAVSLLDPDRGVLDTIDQALGGLLLGGALLGSAHLAILFDAKAEILDAIGDLLRVARQRLSSDTPERGSSILAANSLLAVESYFNFLESEIGKAYAALSVSTTEQLTLATGVRVKGTEDLTEALLHSPLPVPLSGEPFGDYLQRLSEYYRGLDARVARFYQGFDAHEAAQLFYHNPFSPSHPKHQATALYEYHFIRLAAEVPVFGVWVGLRETWALQEQQRTSFDGIRRELSTFAALLAAASGVPAQAPNRWLRGLRTVAQRKAQYPLFHPYAGPNDAQLPPAIDCYVTPSYRIMPERAQFSFPGHISAWQELPVHRDVLRFVASFVVSPGAYESPLLVLGEPGAGKSLLGNVICATLPDGYRGIQVELRHVHADASIHQQITEGISTILNENVAWGDLAEASQERIVVILDGLDELLLATRLSQSDYLERVRDFQQRELELDRPVCVVVTSRTLVAQRTRIPNDSPTIRLEPFSTEQVSEWLGKWTAGLNSRSEIHAYEPLTFEDVAEYAELAAEPVLLAMLALLDLETGAVHSQRGSNLRSALYERLLSTFARREVIRGTPSRADAEVERLVQRYLLELEIIALGMAARGGLAIAEEQIEEDFKNLLLDLPVRHGAGAGFGRELSAAALEPTRFFFMHASSAKAGERRARSYEFIHASFAEYLLARFVATLLADDVAAHRRDNSISASFRNGGAFTLPFSLMLRCTSLASRVETLSFLREIASELRFDFDGLEERLGEALAESAVARALDQDVGPLAHSLGISAQVANLESNIVLLRLVFGGGATTLAREDWIRVSRTLIGGLSDETLGLLLESVDVLEHPDGVTLALTPGLAQTSSYDELSGIPASPSLDLVAEFNRMRANEVRGADERGAYPIWESSDSLDYVRTWGRTYYRDIAVEPGRRLRDSWLLSNFQLGPISTYGGILAALEGAMPYFADRKPMSPDDRAADSFLSTAVRLALCPWTSPSQRAADYDTVLHVPPVMDEFRSGAQIATLLRLVLGALESDLLLGLVIDAPALVWRAGALLGEDSIPPSIAFAMLRILALPRGGRPRSQQLPTEIVNRIGFEWNCDGESLSELQSLIFSVDFELCPGGRFVEVIDCVPQCLLEALPGQSASRLLALGADLGAGWPAVRAALETLLGAAGDEVDWKTAAYWSSTAAE